jgi:hypothetical protein
MTTAQLARRNAEREEELMRERKSARDRIDAVQRRIGSIHVRVDVRGGVRPMNALEQNRGTFLGSDKAREMRSLLGPSDYAQPHWHLYSPIMVQLEAERSAASEGVRQDVRILQRSGVNEWLHDLCVVFKDVLASASGQALLRSVAYKLAELVWQTRVRQVRVTMAADRLASMLPDAFDAVLSLQSQQHHPHHPPRHPLPPLHPSSTTAGGRDAQHQHQTNLPTPFSDRDDDSVIVSPWRTLSAHRDDTRGPMLASSPVRTMRSSRDDGGVADEDVEDATTRTPSPVGEPGSRDAAAVMAANNNNNTTTTYNVQSTSGSPSPMSGTFARGASFRTSVENRANALEAEVRRLKGELDTVVHAFRDGRDLLLQRFLDLSVVIAQGASVQISPTSTGLLLPMTPTQAAHTLYPGILRLGKVALTDDELPMVLRLLADRMRELVTISASPEQLLTDSSTSSTPPTAATPSSPSPSFVLDMSDNELTDKAAATVGAFLQQEVVQRLRLLDLRRNRISRTGIRLIAEGARLAPRAKHVTVEHTGRIEVLGTDDAVGGSAAGGAGAMVPLLTIDLRHNGGLLLTNPTPTATPPLSHAPASLLTTSSTTAANPSPPTLPPIRPQSAGRRLPDVPSRPPAVSVAPETAEVSGGGAAGGRDGADDLQDEGRAVHFGTIDE